MTAIRPSPAVAELLGEEFSDPEFSQSSSSLVFAHAAALHRSSLAEPYFKTKHRALKPVENKEVVQLRKKAGQMGRDFQTLLAAHERQEAAVVDLRGKLRQLRQEAEGKDKALELARRTIERLTAEKGAMEAGAAGTQAYVRKLEARLLSVRHAAELQQRCTQLKAQADSMAHALHQAEARAVSAEATARDASLDAACLKRGLELAAEQLTKSAGVEVPGTLLKAVARGQEEALELSVQLSDAKQQVAQLTAALEQAREHLQAQQAALTQQRSDRQDLCRRAEAAEAALDKQRAATAELRRVLDALRPKAGALAEERELLRRQVELERTAAADAQKEVKQLRATLRQKAATEAALRDELRHALAGDAATPSPSRRQPTQSRAASLPPRSGTRADSRRLQQQQAVLPNKRASGAEDVRAAAPKGDARRASSSEQPRQHMQSGRSGTARETLLILAEPSPTRALAKLLEQRRAQQGSRLSMQPGSAGAKHQRQAHAQPPGAGWSRAKELALHVDEQEDGLAEGAAPWSPLMHAEQQQLGQQQQERKARKPAPLSLETGHRSPSVLPVQDDRLMKVYTSALDEEIAMLESDLAQLEGVASPIALLKMQHVPAGAVVRPVGGESSPLSASKAGMGQQLADQAAEQQEGDAIPAWRPNGAFQAAAESPQRAPHGSNGMQQLVSPGADTPVPPLWHSNPLAGSPPLKQPTPHQQQVGTQPPTFAAAGLDVRGGCDGALTVRAMEPLNDLSQQAELELQFATAHASSILPAAAAQAASGASAALPSWSLQQEEDRLWSQLQQALLPVSPQPPPLELQAPGSAAASSPSLRLPAEWRTEQQQEQQRCSQAQSPLSATGSVAQQATQQQPVAPSGAFADCPAASEDSCGGGQGVASLSSNWNLPSPEPGATDWLSNEFEADVEQLEVNSSQTLQKRQASASPMTSPGAAAVACMSAKRLGFGAACGNSTEGGGGDWDGEPARGAAGGEDAALAGQAGPLLPRLVPVSSSPQRGPQGADAASLPGTLEFDIAAAAAARQASLAQQQHQAPRTLFDIADMDLHELLSD